MTPLKKYIWLVDTLMRSRDRGLTMEQLEERWNCDDEMRDQGPFAKRTFHRHRHEIRDLFGIDIEQFCSGRDYRYRIGETSDGESFQRWLLDSVAVNRIVADSKDAAQYIAIEKTHSENLPALLEALKEQRMVCFDYTPYWADHTTHYYDFRSYALKMFERRWYLIGCYGTEHPPRIFALDRMSNVELQEESYTRDPAFSLEKMFHDAYGIIVEDDPTPTEGVWLKVDAYQANFLRALPLHSSQIELKRTETYSKFSVRVKPTYDFKQKLLSLGSTVEVLKPAGLRADMRGEIQEMLNKYQEDDE